MHVLMMMIWILPTTCVVKLFAKQILREITSKSKNLYFALNAKVIQLKIIKKKFIYTKHFVKISQSHCVFSMLSTVLWGKVPLSMSLC